MYLWNISSVQPPQSNTINYAELLMAHGDESPEQTRNCLNISFQIFKLFHIYQMFVRHPRVSNEERNLLGRGVIIYNFKVNVMIQMIRFFNNKTHKTIRWWFSFARNLNINTMLFLCHGQLRQLHGLFWSLNRIVINWTTSFVSWLPWMLQSTLIYSFCWPGTVALLCRLSHCDLWQTMQFIFVTKALFVYSLWLITILTISKFSIMQLQSRVADFSSEYLRELGLVITALKT